MRALLPPLLAVLCFAASASGADEWQIDLGPDVLRDRGDAPATRIGGWLDASYEDSDHAPSAGGFNHVNGFADTRWRDFQLFVEGEYERETDVSGYRPEHQIELEQAYLRWQPSEALGVRAGRFNTPFGWWVPIHWSILMDSVTPPPHVGDDVVPEQQLGLELAGHVFPHPLGLDGELGWSLFGGYGNDGFDTDRSQGVACGGDLRLRLAERYLLGVSAYRQQNKQLDDRRELSGVVYGEAGLPFDLTLRSEYVRSRRERVAEMTRDADAFYVSLRWDPHPLGYLAYRFGYGEEDDEDLLVTDERGVHTVTLGIVPRPDVRVKLEYSHNELVSRTRPDFDHWVVSVGYLF